MTATSEPVTSIRVVSQKSTQGAVETFGLMSPLEIVHIAWEGVARNKVRSLLTMLGVIIGVAAVIIMIAVSAGTEATIAEQIQGLGANLVFIQASFGRGGPRAPGATEDRTELIYDDVALVAGVKGVVGTSVEMPTQQSIKAGATTLTEVQLVGTTPDFPSVREAPLAQGRFLNTKDLERKSKVTVLGAGLAQELFGDADPIGQSITANNVKLTVIGVMAKKGTVGNTDYDARMYVPITLVFDKFLPSQFARFVGHRVQIIFAQIDKNAVMDDVITQIKLKLANSKGVSVDELPFTLRTQNDIIETQGAATEAFRNLLAWVAGVSLIVGGIGIMNIMLVSVTERTQEIGIRQSVGATPTDIRLQFLTEALMLSLVGGLIGVLAGVGGSILFGATSDMRTVIVPSSILLAFASAAAIGVFFGFYPANKAAQLDPIEALRHE